ncbi:M10 family metallopeptidase [Rhizobium sp. TRM95796]|uniref:M10 family metallopeptidase n=1 Tax=Rhizobium sp. TRM95796 TaxID=2979862 RepID=UPI0021E8CC45|nr:M10 family metallopeptidase [Rhizobium sp. TRM95796]MCV3769072.1 M10 family metallopeptidase C-terminal domain-containing protein [Rhizobium sp. TRM95796]
MVDGLIYGVSWSGEITYAFPKAASDYSYQQEAGYRFAELADTQKTASLFALEKTFGGAANDGFSVEGFTNANLSSGDSDAANIRIARSGVPTTAYTYMPGNVAEAGDVWLGRYQNYENAKAGNYAWHTIIHELGHSLGLKHGHAAYGDFAALPRNYDSVEYTVMTYRTYEGGGTGNYSYATWSAPQTYMMADIATLQHMYGADFTTNGGNTTYSWTPKSGDTYVNGKLGIDAGGNKIFATIWDGSGVDTYDLSAYSADLKLNLAPGECSVFSQSQRAELGRNHLAQGSIYNALLYENDTRSLIENAIGGSGDDQVLGNIAKNRIGGRSGDDAIFGLGGDDFLFGNSGDDRLLGGNGNDRLNGGLGSDLLSGGDDNDKLFGYRGNDRLLGGAGTDVLNAGLGKDILIGGNGNDRLTGGSGPDRFVFGRDGGRDVITDFDVGEDTLVFKNSGFSNKTDILDAVHRQGADVIITLDDSSTVQLENVSVHQLELSHFML